jgi:hypothetical protein
MCCGHALSPAAHGVDRWNLGAVLWMAKMLVPIALREGAAVELPTITDGDHPGHG